MDDLAECAKAVIGRLADRQMDEPIDLFGRGGAMPRKAWLLETFLKNLVGYKMQLFLYIKASGNSGIGTPELWRGEDAKKS